MLLRLMRTEYGASPCEREFRRCPVVARAFVKPDGKQCFAWRNRCCERSAACVFVSRVNAGKPVLRQKEERRSGCDGRCFTWQNRRCGRNVACSDWHRKTETAGYRRRIGDTTSVELNSCLYRAIRVLFQVCQPFLRSFMSLLRGQLVPCDSLINILFHS
jgi:hypothetical protein